MSKMDERYNKYVLNKEQKVRQSANISKGTNSRDISLIIGGEDCKISKISRISPQPLLRDLE